MHRTISFIAVVLFLSLAGCSRATGQQTAAAMRNHLETEIPTGTSVAVAESRLKQQGFAVSHETNASWGDRSPASYLYGDMYEDGVVKRRWQVAVFHENDAVTEIDVTTGLVGP